MSVATLSNKLKYTGARALLGRAAWGGDCASSTSFDTTDSTLGTVWVMGMTIIGFFVFFVLLLEAMT